MPALTTGLIDDNPEVRREAATALGAFGTAATPALPALRKASGDGTKTSRAKRAARC